MTGMARYCVCILTVSLIIVCLHFAEPRMPAQRMEIPQSESLTMTWTQDLSIVLWKKKTDGPKCLDRCHVKERQMQTPSNRPWRIPNWQSWRTGVYVSIDKYLIGHVSMLTSWNTTPKDAQHTCLLFGCNELTRPLLDLAKRLGKSSELWMPL